MHNLATDFTVFRMPNKAWQITTQSAVESQTAWNDAISKILGQEAGRLTIGPAWAHM